MDLEYIEKTLATSETECVQMGSWNGPEGALGCDLVEMAFSHP